jgi:hypothetical protein
MRVIIVTFPKKSGGGINLKKGGKILYPYNKGNLMGLNKHWYKLRLWLALLFAVTSSVA